jgi:hypothetical protein
VAKLAHFPDTQDVVDFTESASEGQGDADPDVVCAPSQIRILLPWSNCGRGLDNAGKTTIVKRIMDEDVNSVSPTLGFIIKTIEYNGYV